MAKNKGKERKNEADNKNKKEYALRFKDDNGHEEYGQVQQKFRHGRYCEVMCVDNVKRYCRIRGKEAQTNIFAGDIILVDLRDGGKKAKGYHNVIVRYELLEARLLHAYGELPDHIVLDDDDYIDGWYMDKLDHRVDFKDEL